MATPKRSAKPKQPRNRVPAAQGKSKEYAVGYKKPPKEYQWKPGQSGNPSGRHTTSHDELKKLIFWAEFCTTRWLSPLWRVVCLTGFHAFPVLLADEDGQPVVCAYCGKILNYTEPIPEWAEIGEVKL